MLRAISPSLPACLRARRIISPCALCKAPIVGTRTRRFACGCVRASAMVVMIRIVETELVIEQISEESSQPPHKAAVEQRRILSGSEQQMESRCFEPDRLPVKAEFLVAEILPTGIYC